MRKKLGIMLCLLGLGVSILCPSVCAAKELSHTADHDCCGTQSHHPQADSCTNTCNLHHAKWVPDHTQVPQFELFQFTLITVPSVFYPTIHLQFSGLVEANRDHPPGYLVFLKTIRLQC